MVIVQKVTLNLFAFVTQRNKELIKAIMAIVLHDVPEDWPAANLDHRLRLNFSFFSQARTNPASQNHNVHTVTRSCNSASRGLVVTRLVVHGSRGLIAPGIAP